MRDAGKKAFAIITIAIFTTLILTFSSSKFKALEKKQDKKDISKEQSEKDMVCNPVKPDKQSIAGEPSFLENQSKTQDPCLFVGCGGFF